MTTTEEINNMLQNKLQTYYDTSLKIMIKKVCGHEMLYLFGEYDTSLHMIERVSTEFPSHVSNEQNKFWVTNRDEKTIELPRERIRLTDFFRDNKIPAIYPLPISTVYQVWFDDHHPHDDCIN